MISPDGIKTKSLLGDYFLSIPKYQRTFKWSIDHAKDFWEDVKFITDEKIKNKKDYDFFIGTILLLKTQNNKSFEVIDGQQRITSITLFLIAMRSHLQKIKYVAENQKERNADPNTLQNYITHDDGTPRLAPSPSVEDVFNEMCKFEWDGEPIEEINGRGVKLQWNRIAKVYTSFKTNIEKLGEDKEKLIEIINNVLNIDFIMLVLDSEEEAYHIFETTNARGLELTVGDLLKNYLFMKLGDQVEDDWDEIKANTSVKGGSLVQAIKFFYTSENGYVTNKQLYRKLKELRGEDPKKLLNDLKLFSEFYKVYISPRKYEVFENWFKTNIYKIRSNDQLSNIYQSVNALRVFNITQTAPLIYSFLRRFVKLGMQTSNYKNLPSEFIEFLENYHFINNFICDSVGNEVEKKYADWSKEFSNIKDDKEFLAKVTDITSKLASNELCAVEDEFTASFVRFKFEESKTKREEIRYIFNKFNKKYLSKHSNSQLWNPEEATYKEKKPNFSVEHWAPQSRPNNDENYAKIWENSIEKNQVYDEIGNLFVITQSMNEILGNKSPASKYKEIKKAKNIEQYKFLSEIDNYADKLAEWDDAMIGKRAKELARDAYRRAWRCKTISTN